MNPTPRGAEEAAPVPAPRSRRRTITLSALGTLLVGLLGVFMITGTAAAGPQYGTATLSWATPSAAPGDTVKLTVSTADDPNPNGGGDGGNNRYVVSFPTAALTYVSHTDSGTCTLTTGDGNNGDISDPTCSESPGAGRPGDPTHSNAFTFTVAATASGEVDVDAPVIDYGRENHYGVTPDPQSQVAATPVATDPTTGPTTFAPIVVTGTTTPGPTSAPTTTPTTTAPTTTTTAPPASAACTKPNVKQYGACVGPSAQKVIDHLTTLKGFKRMSSKQQKAFLNAIVPTLVKVDTGKSADRDLALVASIVDAVLAR